MCDSDGLEAAADIAYHDNMSLLDQIESLNAELVTERAKLVDLGNAYMQSQLQRQLAEQMLLKFAEACRDVLIPKHYPRIVRRLRQIFPECEGEDFKKAFPIVTERLSRGKK